jgi:hypothetical protein
VDQSPIQIQKWLDRYKNQVLKITKVEKGDLDEASIKLRQADLIEHEDTDDYLSPQALLLMGEGTIMTDAGRIPLPQQTYEIALTGHWTSHFDEHSLQLHTERGTYTIEPESMP